MELQDYTEMLAFTEAWKRTLSEHVDALWAATGNYEMDCWAREVGIRLPHLIAVSEYYQPTKQGAGGAYAVGYEPTDREWLIAESVLEIGLASIFKQ